MPNSDSHSDYANHREQERVGKVAELQRLIAEGVESGVSDRSMDEILKLARTRAVAAQGS